MSDDGASADLLDDLVELLRIPSISSGGGDAAELRRAAGWLCERISAAGGEAHVQETPGNPLVVGELRARRAQTPTVLLYGHYDVQSADPVSLWTSPPFEPAVRDGRLYARGACDDKGNFLPLLHVACRLARAGELPVHVRVLVDGEEEVGGTSAAEWVAADERGADCALVFDSSMLDERTPALTLSTRGSVSLTIEVRTGRSDLHSGVYGNAVLNAVHVLARMLAAVLPDQHGRLRDELRAGLTPPGPQELAAWSELPDAAAAMAEVGAHPHDAEAVAGFYRRTWAEPSLDVTGFGGGDPVQTRTIIPAAARAKLAMRVAPGQSAAELRTVLERLLRGAAPEGAQVDITVNGVAEPSRFDPELPALRLAAEALERACGVAPALVRTGGSLPVLAAFAERGLPTVLSGFGTEADGVHGPDESFRLESLRLAERAAEELYPALARLGSSG